MGGSRFAAAARILADGVGGCRVVAQQHRDRALAAEPAPPEVIRAELGGMLAIRRAGLPPSLLTSIIVPALVSDSERNMQICDDVLQAYHHGRNCLVLTGRTNHVDL